MVVDDGQRMPASSLDFDGSLEVELPEFIGGIAFEALDGWRRGGRLWDEALVPFEDLVDGGDGGHVDVALGEEGVDFACAPSELVADGQDASLALRVGLMGADAWAFGLVVQGLMGVLVVAFKPLVACFSTDAEALAGIADAVMQMDDAMDKSDSLLGHGGYLPRHA